MISFEQSQAIFRGFPKLKKARQIDLADAVGYVLAEDILADRDYPPAHRSKVDGVALKSDCISQNNFECTTTVFPGEGSLDLHSNLNCVKIMTGAVLPQGFDVVVPFEELDIQGDQVRLKTNSCQKWQHIALQGEDCGYEQLIIPKFTWIKARHIAVMAALGFSKISVIEVPSVAIISTGNELFLADGRSPKAWEMRDINKHSIEQALAAYRISIASYHCCKDNEIQLKAAIKSALEADIVISSGAVSMGEADVLPKLYQDCGFQQQFHRIKMKPGKPLFLGKNKQNKLAFGLPGNPLSVGIHLKVSVEQGLRALLGLKSLKPQKIQLDQSRLQKYPLDEFFLVKCNDVKGVYEEISAKSSGDIFSRSFAAGFVHHPIHKKHIVKDDYFDFYPWEALC